MDKRKLNYRFHNPNPREALERQLLRICVDANMKKVEEAVRREAEREKVFRVIAVAKSAKVAKLKEATLFKMPEGEFGGRYYRISNQYVNERQYEIVLELPDDTEITLTDEELREREKLSLDGFVKAVAGKSEKDYQDKYRLPSTVFAENIKFNQSNQTAVQSVK